MRLLYVINLSLQTVKTSFLLNISSCFFYFSFFLFSLPAGHKFVWPPQKTTAEPVLASNITPTLPCYRPPPGTQHASPAPKFGSPLSPTPTSPTPAAPAFVRVPPQTSPKPRNPVQSTKAQTWNVSSGTTTTTSSTGMMQSGVAMNIGSGARPAPRRGRGQMKQQVATGARIPICNICGTPIR